MICKPVFEALSIPRAKPALTKHGSSNAPAGILAKKCSGRHDHTDSSNAPRPAQPRSSVSSMKSTRSTAEAVFRRFWSRLIADPAESVRICRPVEPGFSGASVWQIQLAQSAWSLKATPIDTFERERLVGLHRLLQHVHRSGVTQVAVPVASTALETLVDHSGHFWELTPWLPGSCEPGTGASRVRVAAAAVCLAQWHLAAARFLAEPAWMPWFYAADSGVPPALAHRLRLLEPWNRRRMDHLDGLLAGGRRTELTDLSRSLLCFLRRDVPRVSSELHSVGALTVPLQPCLRDVWRAHILFAGEEITGLIDPHAARSESVAGDLARLLGTLVGNDPVRWQAGLASYAAVRPLSDAERLLIRVYDRSGLLLAGAAWLEWLHLSEDRVPFTPGVCERMRHIVSRLQDGLPECPVG